MESRFKLVQLGLNALAGALAAAVLAAAGVIAAGGGSAIVPGSDSTPLSPQIALSATTGVPNDHVTVTGVGFPANEIVALYLDSPALYLDVPGPRSDASGKFSKTVTVPGASNGTHHICGDTGYPGANQPVAAKACVPFVIHGSASPKPSATPAPARSPASAVELIVAALVVLAIGAGLFFSVRK